MGQKRYAYLIGANGPHTERLHSLKYAEKDAEYLAKALQGSRCAFQVKWMKAIEADVILEGLEEFSQQCESSDQLVVHFVNSSEKLPKSATPKVSRGGEFSVGTAECQSQIPQNACSPKRCPSFFTYKFSYLLVISSCPSPCVFREGEGLPFSGFEARSWNTPALRFSRRR